MYPIALEQRVYYRVFLITASGAACPEVEDPAIGTILLSIIKEGT